MKTIELTSIKTLQISQAPTPQIKEDTDVLLKVECVGVCGSDIHYYETGRIGSQIVNFPYRIGHEFSATVVDTGKSVTRVKIGDQVAVDPAMPCYRCDQCLTGRENTCRELLFLGCPGQAPGCLCEYIVMPEGSVFPTHGKISLEKAALVEPLSIGVYALKQAHLQPSSSLAILGSGPIGLCVLIAALAQGHKEIYMTDVIKERVQLANKGGALWSGNPKQQDVTNEIIARSQGGVDAVFECAGQQETLDQAIDILKPGGKLSIVGIPRESKWSFSVDLGRRKEITLINVRRQNQCMQQAIDIIAENKVQTDFMLTHQFPFENTSQAFNCVANYQDGVAKAIIHISKSK